MKLPTAKKILREDLKDAPDWVSGIITPVNSFMETVYQAMNKNMTLQENISSFVKEITYKTPSTYPTMEVISFQNELKSKPIGVMLMQIYDKSTYSPVLNSVYIPWIVNDKGGIEIHPITGLAADKTYMVRLVIF